MTYEQTTAGLLERNARVTPDKIFVTFPGGSWTYRETLDRARSVANGLRGVGVAPGDYVASWLPNGPEALLALLGVNLAGAVQVPMNTAYRGGLLEHALNLSKARTLIVHHELVEYLASIEAPHLQTMVVVGGEPSSITDARFDVVAWSRLETGDSSELAVDCRRSATDDMVVIFTSGTTGPSKGVQCSYLHHASYAEWFRTAPTSLSTVRRTPFADGARTSPPSRSRWSFARTPTSSTRPWRPSPRSTPTMR